MRTRYLLAALATGATVIAVAACGTGSDKSPGTPGSSTLVLPSSVSAVHNTADTTFAQSMIMHHQQAVQMANMAVAKATKPDVKQLARQIADAQQPQITTMSGWLSAWGEHPMHDMPNMQHSPMTGMDGKAHGMVSPADLTRLAKATGTDFDRLFLQLMIEHHEGAVEMARSEQTAGLSAEAKSMAKQIETAQSAEIEQMRRLLGTL